MNEVGYARPEKGRHHRRCRFRALMRAALLVAMALPAPALAWRAAAAIPRSDWSRAAAANVVMAGGASAADESLLSPSDDLYSLLGTHHHATAQELRDAFRLRAKQCHPDVSAAPDAASQFRRLAAAFEILSDQSKRVAWDSNRQPASSRAAARGRGAQVDTEWTPQWASATDADDDAHRPARWVSLLTAVAFVAGQYLIFFIYLTGFSFLPTGGALQ